MKWTPQTLVGALILLMVAVACVVWLSLNPQSTPAWALTTQIVQVAGKMAGGA